ncbi:MAG: hypothetical protein AAF962_15410 [Actinomycetota bacterium]
MEFVVLGLAVVLVVVVGLLFVGWAVGKTTAMPDQIVIDAEEAIEFCAEALPVSVTSVMSYDELRRALRLHLEWVQFYHWAPDGQTDGPVLFEEFDPLDYVMERAEMVDLDISREHAKAVIEAQSSYLQVVGAIHLDDPVQVEADLADHPMLGAGTDAAALEDGDSERS